jgi:hypothetical protein
MCGERERDARAERAQWSEVHPVIWRLGLHHTAGERDDVPATSDVGRVLTCRVFCRSRRGHLSSVRGPLTHSVPP